MNILYLFFLRVFSDVMLLPQMQKKDFADYFITVLL